MLYSLLSVHTQILVVCKLNLWRVRRQICTEKQNNNYLIINRYRSTRSECSELKYLSVYFFIFKHHRLYSIPSLYSYSAQPHIWFLFHSRNKVNIFSHNSNKTLKPNLNNTEM